MNAVYSSRAFGGDKRRAWEAVVSELYASMDVQVQGDDQRPAAVQGGQRGRLPAPCGQPQRGVLQLRLGRSELDRELAEHLTVRVQCVAGRLPLFVGTPRPPRGHDSNPSRAR